MKEALQHTGITLRAVDEAKAVMQIQIDALEDEKIRLLNALNFARNRLKYFGKSTLELDSVLEEAQDKCSKCNGLLDECGSCDTMICWNCQDMCPCQKEDESW